MEKAVNNSGNELLAQALGLAAKDGEELTPDKLATFIDGFEQPLRLLEDADQAAQLFHAFHEQFNFIRLSFRPPWPPEQSVDGAVDLTRYASLLRWLIDGMRIWDAASDSKLARLTAMIVVAQTCDSGNALWNLLPDDIGANSNLVNQLSRVAASIDLTIVSAGGQPPPIREAEIVEAFLKADAEGDWANIIGGWRRFPPIFPSALQTQTMRFLLRYARPQLLACLNKIQKTPLAFILAQVFTPEQCLQLALESESRRFQFAAVYRSFTDQWRSHRTPTSSETALLTDLLIEVSKDPSCWDGWMLALAQQPELQEALGRALIHVPDAALKAYVDAIRLWSRSVQPNPMRQSITNCLRAFCAGASLERRSVLWTIAFERWRAWRFSDNGLRTAIQRSDLDYAVVGYALECMTQDARDQAATSIFQRISVLEDQWHEGISDIVHEYYRLLSELQPYAHASQVARSGGDWLPQATLYVPDGLQSSYLTLMYGPAQPT
ncbi:hypothetical protein [Bradyrhizobium japonicum]|uniref:hypothetical protein n=1 Tax=Bradyrhizobium japonicum TaxID=375 RepID=UPI001E2D6742|nr:hypothetical protein [Bradyrhizobium japonicum]MCD9824042.1 hypothetical protein [Bradyrhizobium japonicum]MCD9896596.1 hypothetical protein [Bradyrhizobium japonicum]MEB2671089.1 hypothetical protein [Bradyrhizobium japonicum]WLB28670.1 hypothetical protein QIH85_44070 [Bradyrhizobium japonicum]WRI90412.1 hypothetical protein R3F75_05485 [Bradyrhizobium japonicum]